MRLRIRPYLYLCCGAYLFTSLSYADSSFIADGVNKESPIASDRFYDTGKGCYWWGDPLESAVLEEYQKQGNYDFLGDLKDKITSNTGKRTDLYYLTLDSNMCWAYTSSNVLQYWQSYYGVFYKKGQEMGQLTYGYTYDKSYFDQFGGTQSLKLSELFVDTHKNGGSTARAAFRWYLAGLNSDNAQLNSDNKGGYFSNFFSGKAVDLSISDLAYMDSSELAQSFSTAMGCTISAGNNEIIRQNEGQIAYLSISAKTDGMRHAVTCYGFTLDESGGLKSVLFTNSDDREYGLIEVYVKEVDGKNLLFTDAECTQPWGYAQATDWTIESLTYIETPKSLKDLYAEYNHQDTALTWNGQKATWGQEVAASSDVLPTSETGWSKYSGSNTIYADYYDSYYESDRKILFNDSALSSTYGGSVALDSDIRISQVEIHANQLQYDFAGNQHQLVVDQLQKNGAALASFSQTNIHTAEAIVSQGVLLLKDRTSLVSENMIVETGASLRVEQSSVQTQSLCVKDGAILEVRDSTLNAQKSEFQDGSHLYVGSGILTLGNSADISLYHVTMEAGASIVFAQGITPGVILVRGDFLISAEAMTLNLSLDSSVNSMVYIGADLDLRQATQISISSGLDMGGHSLFVNSWSDLLDVSQSGMLVCSNYEILYINGHSYKNGDSVLVEDIYGEENLPNGYQKGDTLILSDNFVHAIPEPSSTLLGLLGIGGLVIRRRRR